MKNYRKHSKFVIAVCVLLVAATVLNYFTGIINTAMPGSSHVICILGFCVTIIVTIMLEKERLSK